MVQHSLSVGFVKELPHQSGDSKETSYRVETIFLKENEKRCINSTSYKNIKNHQMCNEQKTKVLVWWDDLALKQASKEPINDRWHDECIDGTEEDLQPSGFVPASYWGKSLDLGTTDNGHCTSHVLESSLWDISDSHSERFRLGF